MQAPTCPNSTLHVAPARNCRAPYWPSLDSSCKLHMQHASMAGASSADFDCCGLVPVCQSSQQTTLLAFMPVLNNAQVMNLAMNLA